jgi:hypothetical protein
MKRTPKPFASTPSTAIVTPRTTRPELFGACQVRPRVRGARHAAVGSR